MIRYNFTKAHWSLLMSHPGFRLFLRFRPAVVDVEHAGLQVLRGMGLDVRP